MDCKSKAKASQVQILSSPTIKGSGVTATRRSLKPGPSEGVILGSNPSSPANYRPFRQLILVKKNFCKKFLNRFDSYKLNGLVYAGIV